LRTTCLFATFSRTETHVVCVSYKRLAQVLIDNLEYHNYMNKLSKLAIFGYALSMTSSMAWAQENKAPTIGHEAALTKAQQLGKRIFFDTNLSEPRGQSCASCHAAEKGFSGNNGSIFGAPLGATGVVGLRNTPTAKYTGFIPAFNLQKQKDGTVKPIGGHFHDGRVNTLEDQAKQPFLSAIEMNNVSVKMVMDKIKTADYAPLLRDLYGEKLFNNPEAAFNKVAAALADYQRSAEMQPFDSKYDAYVRGEAALNEAEQRGLQLFKNKDKGNCIACHVMNDQSRKLKDNLFTDFSYDNLGVPRNMKLPGNADKTFYDLGLCGPKTAKAKITDTKLCGAFRVPTLRNVALKQAFMHNGTFDNLRDAVSFYFTRDTQPEKWYGGDKFNDLPQKFKANVNREEVPYNRKPNELPAASDTEIGDIVTFLQTLNDGYKKKSSS
jgi:cytochrome c peroxidase